MAKKYKPTDPALPPLRDLLKVIDELDLDEVPNIADDQGWEYRIDDDRFYSDGEPVDYDDVQAVIDEQADAATEDLRGILKEMTEDEDADLGDTERRFAQEIAALLALIILLGLGGDRDLLKDRENDLHGLISEQFRYLRKFFENVAQGNLSVAQILSRAKAYARGSTVLYERGRDWLHDLEEYPWERNILGICLHCQLCPEETEKGWQPRGTLIPIGQRDCLMNCCCRMEYAAGEEQPDGQSLQVKPSLLGSRLRYGWAGIHPAVSVRSRVRANL